MLALPHRKDEPNSVLSETNLALLNGLFFLFFRFDFENEFVINFIRRGKLKWVPFLFPKIKRLI